MFGSKLMMRRPASRRISSAKAFAAGSRISDSEPKCSAFTSGAIGGMSSRRQFRAADSES